MDTRIISHHVGGRGFGVSLNTPPVFWGDLVHVLYEADADNARQMMDDLSRPQKHQLGAHLGAEFFIAPYCLGERAGQQTLHLTANAFASSLFEPNQEFFNYYCEVPIPHSFRDFTYHDMLEIVDQVPVDVLTLDSLFEKNKVPFPELPDFLSIDTQGYELAIIKGGRKTIERHVLAIASEVEIKSMYLGQPLLGDLLTYLDARGFHFAGFPYLQEVSTYRGPIGFRGKGFPAFGDALFLRRIDDLKKLAESPSELFLMLRKLAFIAIHFGHIEYGLQALMEAERVSISKEDRALFSERKYSHFLDEVLKTYSAADPLYPRFFVTPEESKPAALRQREASDRPGQVELKAGDVAAISDGEEKAANRRQRSNVQQSGTLTTFRERIERRAKRSQSLIRHLAWRDPLTAIAKALVYADQYAARALRRSLYVGAERVMVAPRSSFEALLLSYGFVSVAELVQARRVTTEATVRREGPAPSDGPNFGPTTAS